jgi:(+)-trans-carveol dehydrogenase/(-)-trans-carveol dehydrogenase
LAEEGADIIAVDLCREVDGLPCEAATWDDLQHTVKEVETLGRRIVARQADVRDADSLAAALTDGVEQLGRLDIVAANAGILSRPAKAADLADRVWQDTIDINLTGVWHTAKVAIPHLVAGGRGGSMVLTSSTAGMKGSENIAHYSAAKHGVLGLMKSLALELAAYSIRVNSVLPSQVDTPMIMNDSVYRLFRPELDAPTRDDFRPASASVHPLPVPWIDPIDVSNALLFLVSDEARYITGAALPVDAGCLLKLGNR